MQLYALFAFTTTHHSTAKLAALMLPWVIASIEHAKHTVRLLEALESSGHALLHGQGVPAAQPPRKHPNRCLIGMTWAAR